MLSLNSLKSNVFHINNQNFDRHAIALFQFQYNNNKIYQKYVNHLGIRPQDVNHVKRIPFLPIRFFKSNIIKTGSFQKQHVFLSTGTTGTTSKHYIEDLEYYKKVSAKIFSSFYGELEKSVIIGLLPSYLERDNSSLVYMVNHFIEKSGNPHSGFYLKNLNELVDKIQSIATEGSPIYLFGVTFALLQLAANYKIDVNSLHILETGGMKGRGEELTREELHIKLRSAFNTKNIYSEYGMTELLSQAYMKRDGLFYAPPWMKVFVREIHDPFCYVEEGKTGVIKVIDMANVHSCAFVETEDLGINIGDGFNVLGRLDNSDIRGCNLLLS